MHFGSWDSHKDWSVPLPSNESITAVAIGNGWIAVATSKRMLRLFTVGGVQREVLSVPGHVITLAAWGPRLSVVYQLPPCELGVDTDILKRAQYKLDDVMPCVCLALSMAISIIYIGSHLERHMD